MEILIKQTVEYKQLYPQDIYGFTRVLDALGYELTFLNGEATKYLRIRERTEQGGH